MPRAYTLIHAALAGSLSKLPHPPYLDILAPLNDSGDEYAQGRHRSFRPRPIGLHLFSLSVPAPNLTGSRRDATLRRCEYRESCLCRVAVEPGALPPGPAGALPGRPASADISPTTERLTPTRCCRRTGKQYDKHRHVLARQPTHGQITIFDHRTELNAPCSSDAPRPQIALK